MILHLNNLPCGPGLLERSANRKFTAREEDGTGLYYYRARYYHPILARFVSEDPRSQFAGNDLWYSPDLGTLLELSIIRRRTRDTNLFTYVGNDPLFRIDPLGLWYIDINFTGGFGIGISGGFQIGSKGFHPYLGGGLTTPGLGGSLTWSPHDPCPHQWSGQAQVALGLAGAKGADLQSITQGFNFWEIGIGTPGISGTAYYTW